MFRKKASLIESRTVPVLFLIGLVTSGADSLRCNRSPEGVAGPPSRPQGSYKIEISGNPDAYTPNEEYIVAIRSISDDHRFKEFVLMAEQDPREREFSENLNPSVGSFRLKSIGAKFNDKCPNSITNINVAPKSDIEVLWKAPESGSGCVGFKATVVESKDVWFTHEGPLAKILCEEIQETDDIQPRVLEHCCACDEAKYEVTFEGLWSRNTHPKDFPPDPWKNKFSDVIGASHTVDYSFWNYGEVASDGLKEVAENANTRILESELKAKSEHIRTIIKARGISYPNVTGKTFAVFRVDNKHHLVSLVSMIYPSPDWFVGVSSLELCLQNCSWAESKVLNLYPSDAGSDEGITYLSENEPSDPRMPIRRIKSNSPNDARSPFFDPAGEEIKPLARLYLSRQRLYEKKCDPINVAGPDCEVGEWSEWSPCSVTCGKGMKYRQRHYLREEGTDGCQEQLTQRASCRVEQAFCLPSPPVDDRNCELTEWGEWSSCSASCGKGIMTRSRRYKNRKAAKRCAAGLEDPPSLEQNMECEGTAEDCPASQEYPDCPQRPWSKWSTCSASCGKGVKFRYRLDLIQGDQQEHLMQQSSRHLSGEEYRFSPQENTFQDEHDPCEMVAHKAPFEVVECLNDDNPSCEEVTAIDATSACSLPKDVGPCRSNVDKWYFDNISGKCEIFSYSGCQGNYNNFKSLEICEEVCSQYQKELLNNRTNQKKQLGANVSGVLSYNMQIQNDGTATNNCATTPRFNGISVENLERSTTEAEEVTESYDGGDPVDCVLTPWSEWSPCNITGRACGKGFKEKFREVLVPPTNGGKPCDTLHKTKKCRVRCNHIVPHDPFPVPHQEARCVMSEWSTWSPCSQSCGPDAVQLRTRKILRRVSKGGEPCSYRIDEKKCKLLACTDLF